MRTTRTYVDAALATGETLTLGEQASQHLVRVLRRGVGDECIVFNGDGCDYRARLVSVAKKAAVALVLDVARVDNESPLQLTLVQSVARGEKMDWVLQKATELGVCAIIPVLSQRTEVKLDPERAQRRLAHWQAVVVAACEQSGRARIPKLQEPRSLAEHAAASDPAHLRLALDPRASGSLGARAPHTPVELVVGPEGGLSERDLDLLSAAGYAGVRLGPRVLRTETAGIAAVTALQALYGDLCR